LKDQQRTPLFDGLKQFAAKNPFSFHVPGHKNGAIFPEIGRPEFAQILPLDLTEVTGLDDLHAPDGMIAEAEELAAEFFCADKTFFLVGGSTAGNLAMILAACGRDEKIIVQRNSHKSIMNGLELAGARPIFMTPVFDEAAGRYTSPILQTLERALAKHPEAKAVVLTYPDYFGKTYDLGAMIRLCHSKGIPVLVDEAHGVHFALGKPFPAPALSLGADVVVHSAHKMAPAMTMASYLHVQGSRVSSDKIAHYLQVIQSSSPSYPLLASLDLARLYMASMTRAELENLLTYVNRVRAAFAELACSRVLQLQDGDDPLKLTLQLDPGLNGHKAMAAFEQAGLWPELATHDQILFVLGLGAKETFEDLKKALHTANERLKIGGNHATIDRVQLFPEEIQELALTYDAMNKYSYREIPLQEGIGHIAAEAVIPYPPGIPLVMKGERITAAHADILKRLLSAGTELQQRQKQGHVRVFD